jgi:hypothetical protein
VRQGLYVAAESSDARLTVDDVAVTIRVPPALIKAAEAGKSIPIQAESAIVSLLEQLNF